MASPTTYDDLVTAVIAAAEDDSAEFAGYLPTAIGLAEDRVFKESDIDFSSEATLTTTITQSTLAKPTGHRITHNLYLTVSGSRRRLIKKTEDFLRQYWPSTSATDVPKYYADKDDLTWLLAPTPNGSYTVTAEVILKPTYLSDANQTNKLITLAPDALFYASMSAMCDWMQDPDAKQRWESDYNGAISFVNNEGRRARQDDNTHTNNPEGGRNTLKKGEA
jgi:hypothetical protein